MDIHSFFTAERPHQLDDIVKTINDEFNRVCDSVEGHFVSVGTSINEAIRATTWLPDSVKPPPRAPSSGHLHPQVPLGYFETCRKWVSEHRAVTAAIVAFVGTSVFIWHRRRSYRSKRRARRGKNGIRTEVIVLAGSPHSSLTRSLALNLERRGFIVYIPVSDPSEEHRVRSESKADIRPLHLDITSPSSSTNAIQDFAAYLSQPHSSHANNLRLTSLLIIPPSSPPTGLISDIHPMTWSETFTTHLLVPFTTLHAFLPLLATHKSSLLFLTPAIIPSLTPPLNGPENVAAGALHNYIRTLRREVSPQGINAVQLKLGAFDFNNEPGEWALVSTRGEEPSDRPQSKSGGWNAIFPFQYPNPQDFVRGSPPPELHNAVFDAIKRGKGTGGTIFVGRGSRLYDLVAKWIPDGVVGWMMGARQGSWAGNCSASWEKVERDIGY